MKSVFMIAMSFVTTTAIASDLSWEQIKSNPAFHPAFPTVAFNERLISVDALCVEGEYLRPVQNHQERCVAWETVGENRVCVEFERIYLKTPIRHTSTVCTEWEVTEPDTICRRYIEVPEEYRLNYLVEVHDGSSYSSDPGNTKILFIKPYSIPVCR